MAEIVRRRYGTEQLGVDCPTYAVFIDLQKAYDKVPIGIVLAMLRKFGFSEKYTNLIKAVYDSTRMSVRTGDDYSESYEIWRGLRQGCPLSPMLFIVFVTNLLEFIHKTGGVGTPVRGEGDFTAGTCHGLLYADDIVGLEESLESLQNLITALSEWCMRNWMEIGYAKCGTMLWTSNKALIDKYNKTTFVAAFDDIERVDKYKYLGIKVDETFSRSREAILGCRTNESLYVNELVSKGYKTLHRLRPVLIDHFCPIAIKIMLIRTFLFPKMLYGAEWLGFRQLNSAPIQRVINVAAHWVVGLKGKTNATDSMALCYELSLPLIEEEMAAARSRLYFKAKKGTTNTWLSRLVQTKKIGRVQTWVSHSAKEIPKILKLGTKYSTDTSYKWHDQPSADTRDRKAPLREWAARGQAAETHIRSNRYRSPQLEELRELLKDLDHEVQEDVESDLSSEVLKQAAFSFDAAYERTLQLDAVNSRNASRTRFESEQVRLIRECVRERAFTANKSRTFVEWYDVYSFGFTRGFLRNAIRRPDLGIGIRHLIAIRCRFFPRIEQTWLAAKFAGRNPKPSSRYCCPLCGRRIKDGWEWQHLMTSCLNTQVVEARKRFLDIPLQVIRLELTEGDFPGLEIEGVEPDEALKMAIAIYAVGGVVKSYYGSTYNAGFGHIDILPQLMSVHGYVPMAEFLQVVVPSYKAALAAGGNNVELDYL